ncbi:Formamidase [Sporomusa carbonis]|uniref:carbon-nitrogen hydrolase family protein n=1 Tax=Sporomusa carbonis TaxID=3076075 RepID=UPI003A6BB4B0
MKLRVAAVQYRLETITSFNDFAAKVEHYIKTAQEFNADFVLFPEFFTTELMSLPTSPGSKPTIGDLPGFTAEYLGLFSRLAGETGMHIIGGTHVTKQANKLYNTAHLFYPDGRVGKQAKLHITPTEATEWGIAAGEGLVVFPTAFGTVAVLTCYDIEFPEIVRMAKSRGADIIFCPSCTDDRHGFYRVRYTAHARAIENQIYVVVTGTVGALPTVDFMRANFGQAAIITPNDIPFPPRGILAEGEINQDMVIAADLDLDLLYQVRDSGSVTTWRDRRLDLYPEMK